MAFCPHRISAGPYANAEERIIFPCPNPTKSPEGTTSPGGCERRLVVECVALVLLGGPCWLHHLPRLSAQPAPTSTRSIAPSSTSIGNTSASTGNHGASLRAPDPADIGQSRHRGPLSRRPRQRTCLSPAHITPAYISYEDLHRI